VNHRRILFKTIALIGILCLIGAGIFGIFSITVNAFEIPIPQIGLDITGTDDPATLVPTLQLFLLISLLTLAPTLILMFTSFTRLIVVLHFLRSAMGTQQMPPNQILVGLALFLTLFLMGDLFSEINTYAIQPYTMGDISQAEAIERGWRPLHDFMVDQVDLDDLVLFASLANITFPDYDVPLRVLVPAFILSELTRGFIIGFVLYLPFVVIDMIVASILMAMGMMMLPPAMISLPFKILLFILGGGWTFVIEHVLATFRATGVG
jgi:flagellar biosynthetic protein FliP